MILIPEFAASHSATVAGGEGPVPQAEFHRVKPGLSISCHPGEAEVFAVARSVIIKEILALLGGDVPSPTKYTKHLNGLAFSDICAIRDQVRIEKQEQLKAEELRRQPELPTRPVRQMRFFYGRKS
jgi:hypothetical protein